MSLSKLPQRLVLIAVLVLPSIAFSLDDEEIAALEGHIIVGNDDGRKIQILDRDQRTWDSPEHILWDYPVRENADGLKIDFPDFNDVKRVLNSSGQTCLLVAGNPGGIGLFNLETEIWEFSYAIEVNGMLTSTHSAEILPDGNFVSADPTGDNRGGSNVRLIYGNNEAPELIQSIPFPGIHGVVWDHKRQVLWAWGGTLRKFSYKLDGRNSLLTEEKRYERPNWAPGGHDLSAMDGQDKLMFTSRGGIGTFDIESESFEMLYGAIQGVAVNYMEDEKIAGGKGASWDYVTGVISYNKQDQPTPEYKSSRSYKIRNPAVIADGKMVSQDYAPAENGIWYKSRWFRHSPFSYGAIDLVDEKH